MSELPAVYTHAPVAIDQSALARLREKARLETEIQAWKPNPGDVLEGVIVGSRKVDGPFGEQYQALVQRPEGHVVAVWLTQWLLGQFRAQCAELGDLVSLTFHGKETGIRGQSFNRMSVTVLKP
jgi:hypothetical protein